MIVKVLINTSVKTLNKVYDYYVDKDLEPLVELGKRVSISFGRSKSLEEGIIVKVLRDDEYENKDYKLKKINEVLDEVSYIDEKKLKFAKYLSHIYFCNVYDVLKLMLPPGTTSKNSSKKLKVKTNTLVKLNYSPDYIDSFIEEKKITSAKHIRVLKFLEENDLTLLDDIVDGLEISKSVLKTIEKNGYVRFEEVEADDTAFDASGLISTYTKKQLTTSQNEVSEGIFKYIKNNQYKECLLYGITGSGKTEVYLDLIEKTVNMGKNVIMLIPEISLTHQTVSRFYMRFGDTIAILNSKITISKRKETYRKIKEGKVRIVIGARSAIFAPLSNIGLVIIDEAHDQSYYSSTTPKYITKEVASYLCLMENATLVLGTATPEVSDYYKSILSSPKIKRFELKERPGTSTLPEIITVDMKNEKVMGNTSIFSLKLKEAIDKNIRLRKKTMLFLNRRGYKAYIACRSCGWLAKCPNCDVALVYHKKSNLLLCHYCSHVEHNINVCPKCGKAELSASLLGTQKIEEELKEIFPGIKCLRMDADTTVAKDSHEKLLSKFRNEDIDVLIGTQMIAKGHDIADVTLVGVLLADNMLNMNDFMASERAFQNIYQVSGRAGRGEEKGTVIIQTNDETNFVLNAVKENSYEKFYDAEIKFREMFKYPPFVDIVLFEMSSKDLNKLKFDAARLYDILDKNKSERFKVFSPKSPYVQRINNKYRMNIIVKTNLAKTIYDLIYRCIQEYEKVKNKDVTFVVSKNPPSI